METPSITPGRAEQAIYTWSSQRITGGRGEGFGAASPGLGAYIQWLRDFDSKRLQITPPGNDIADSVWASSGFVGYGRFLHSGLAVAYKKMASAGLDEVQRPRFAVHLVIANPEDLDYLWCFHQGEQIFFDASELPLDGLPSLGPLDLEPLGAWLEERSAEDWIALAKARASSAAAMLLFSDPSTHDGALEQDELAVAHLLHPPSLWQGLEVDTYFDGSAVTHQLRAVYPKQPSPPRNVAPTVSTIGIQLSVDVSASVPPDPVALRTYANELMSFGLDRRTRKDAEARQGDDSRARPVRGDGRSGQESGAGPDSALWKVVERFADQSGRHASIRLNDAGIQSAVRTLRDQMTSTELLSCSTAGLAAAFAGATDVRSARDVAEYTSDVPTERVAETWRRTGLPVFLFAVASRSLDESGRVTRSPSTGAVGHTLAWLERETHGYQLIANLVDRGLIQGPSQRQEFVKWVADRPRLLFDQVLPLISGSPSMTLEILRENFDSWSAHRKLSRNEHEALRALLFRRRGQTLLRVVTAGVAGRPRRYGDIPPPESLQ
jgi:hypothetical protein